jgi:hypothetical protein
MPDFEVNEGYVEAGRRRADSPLPERRADELLSADGRVLPDGRDAAPDGRDETPGPALLGEDAVQAKGGGEPLSPPRKLPEQTPIVRRTRHLAAGHFATRCAPGRRVGVRLIARRRRLARRACPYGWQVRVLGAPPRHRRRLWTQCHRSR